MVQRLKSCGQLHVCILMQIVYLNYEIWWKTLNSLFVFGSALTIDTSGISTPPAFHGFSAGLYPENTQSNEPPVNLSALTTSMMGALSASINVPSSILSSGGEAGSSLVSEEGPTPSATNPLSASALVSDMGFGGKGKTMRINGLVYICYIRLLNHPAVGLLCVSCKAGQHLGINCPPFVILELRNCKRFVFDF